MSTEQTQPTPEAPGLSLRRKIGILAGGVSAVVLIAVLVGVYMKRSRAIENIETPFWKVKESTAQKIKGQFFQKDWYPVQHDNYGSGLAKTWEKDGQKYTHFTQLKGGTHNEIEVQVRDGPNATNGNLTIVKYPDGRERLTLSFPTVMTQYTPFRFHEIEIHAERAAEGWKISSYNVINPMKDGVYGSYDGLQLSARYPISSVPNPKMIFLKTNDLAELQFYTENPHLFTFPKSFLSAEGDGQEIPFLNMEEFEQKMQEGLGFQEEAEQESY